MAKAKNAGSLGAAVKKVAEQRKPEEIQRFIRIIEHDRKPGDQFRGYQCETIQVLGNKVMERKLVGKVDVFEMAYSTAGDLVDPREKMPEDA